MKGLEQNKPTPEKRRKSLAWNRKSKDLPPWKDRSEK
jgi:hypothetical protein